VQAERERLRETNASHKALQDELNKTNTVVNIVEHRVADATSSLKTARQNLEDLNEVSVKLHENQEKMRSQVLDLQGVAKKQDEKLKENRELLEHLAAGHQVTQARLAEALNGFDNMRKEKEEHRRQLQNLKQGQELAQGQMQSLRTELADVDTTTRAVKEGLRETSSLLLPNIHLDSSEARSASMRHGSLLQTGNLSAVVATPRKAAHATFKGSTR